VAAIAQRYSVPIIEDDAYVMLPQDASVPLAVLALGALVLVLLWTVIFARLSVERDAATHASMASAAIGDRDMVCAGG